MSAGQCSTASDQVTLNVGIPSTIANAGPRIISGVMTCARWNYAYSSGSYYYHCDASDSTQLSSIETYSNSIYHDTAYANGWKLVEGSVSTEPGSSRVWGMFIFHK